MMVIYEKTPGGEEERVSGLFDELQSSRDSTSLLAIALGWGVAVPERGVHISEASNNSFQNFLNLFSPIGVHQSSFIEETLLRQCEVLPIEYLAAPRP